MIQINPLKSYIDGGVRAALTTPPSASLVFDLPGKAIWVKGVKLKGIDHTYTFNHDNYITLTNTPDKNNPESEDIKIGVNITTLKNVIDTTYNGGTLALLQEGLNTEERTWLAKILHNYINDVLPATKNLKINGINYAIYTTADSLPLFFVPTSLGTTGQILACTSSGLIWIDLIQNTDYRVSLSSATSNSDYRIILKQGANNNPETDFVRFSEYLTFNPYTKTLKINNIKVVTATDIYAGSNAGLVPTATSAQLNYYLRGDGAWVNIATEMAAANTWRPIKVGNTDALGSSANTGTLSFIAGTGIALSWDATNKRIIITNSSPDVNHNTDETVRQVPKTDNVNRPLMMINGSTSAGEQINTSMFSTGIYANASTKMITANGFIKAGSSNSYVLLGGGDHKAISDFAASYHNHYRIKLSDDRAKYPGQLTGNEISSIFGGFMQNSTLGISNFGSYSDVLVIRSYADSSGGNDNAIIFNKNTRGVWHTQFGFGSTTSWGTPYLFLDSNNFNKYTPTLIGTGASGTWNINITGSSASCTGNAATSTLTSGLLGNGYTSGNSNIIRPFWNTKSDNRWYLQSVDLAYLCRVDYATSSGNADTLDGNHASAFASAVHTHDGRYLQYEGYWGDGSGQNIDDSLGMNFTYTSHGAPHHWGTTVTFEYERGSSYRLQLHGTGDNYLFFRNRSSDYGGWHSSGWKQILTNQDTYVASDGTNRGFINEVEVASARHLLINGVTWNSDWHWSGQGGQPSWLWGSNDGSNMYVWNPSNFSVNYASSAGNADTIDSYHASDLFLTHRDFLIGTRDATAHQWNAICQINSVGGAARSFMINFEMHHNSTVSSKTFYVTASLSAGISITEIPSADYDTSNVSIRVGSDSNYYSPTRVDFKNNSRYSGSVRYKVVLLNQGSITPLTDDNVSALSYSKDYTAKNRMDIAGGAKFIGATIIGADATPSYTLDVRGTTRSTDKIYANEWIQFDNATGLYWSNTYGAYFYPNATSTYGQFQLLGTKNSYSGIHFGNSINYMTVMSTDTHHGLYCDSTGWEFYYNRSNTYIGLRTSSTSYPITMNGDSYTNGWSRAASGFYCENTGVYFTHHSSATTIGEIDITSSNEFCWASSNSTLYFNYRGVSRGNTVTEYVWNAGSSSSYASHTTGHITLGNSSYLIKRVGSSVIWIDGRDSAIVRQTSPNGYSAVISSKTASGSWEMGNYTNLGESLYFTYITDSNYNNRNNSITGQVYFNSGGSIYATHFYENSDIRFKTNFSSIDISINQLSEIPLFDFNWVDNTIRNSGTSALAVLQILPNIVSGTDRLTLDYGVLGTIAGITACKELVTLKSEIEQLKEKVKLLEDKLNKYENTL